MGTRSSVGDAEVATSAARASSLRSMRISCTTVGSNRAADGSSGRVVDDVEAVAEVVGVVGTPVPTPSPSSPHAATTRPATTTSARRRRPGLTAATRRPRATPGWRAFSPAPGGGRADRRPADAPVQAPPARPRRASAAWAAWGPGGRCGTGHRRACGRGRSPRSSTRRRTTSKPILSSTSSLSPAPRGVRSIGHLTVRRSRPRAQGLTRPGGGPSSHLAPRQMRGARRAPPLASIGHAALRRT